MTEPPLPTGPRLRYRWPWIVLAFAVAFVVLCVIWMYFEVERVRRVREANPTPPTNTRQTP